MFARRYFGARAFAPRYFPAGIAGATPAAGQNRRHQWPGRRVWFNTFDPLS